MQLFASCCAWFARSVPRTHVDIWLTEGGARVDTPSDQTLYIFSNNCNDPETHRLQSAGKVIYRSAWILDCHLSRGRRAVGPYVLAPRPEGDGNKPPTTGLPPPSPQLPPAFSGATPGSVGNGSRLQNRRLSSASLTSPPYSAHGSSLATPRFRRAGSTRPSPGTPIGLGAAHPRLSVAELVQAYSPPPGSVALQRTAYLRGGHGGSCSGSSSHPYRGLTDPAARRLTKRPRRLSTQSLQPFDTTSHTPSGWRPDPSEAWADHMSDTQSVVSHVSRLSNASSIGPFAVDEHRIVLRYNVDVADPDTSRELLEGVVSFVPNADGYSVRRNVPHFPVLGGHSRH
ncbi:hypothetical protein IWQ60_011422 [Tieghemiomyces parasiticus]|uniref:BRCT domain-containing protein n=1 Tax=Tieghemiomyces parasiticus TaxID=78921 RepID=A0A9W8DHA8_9FUNG|nr:hypothetical protein IWQ60_011422 [Tieghemiomyces parasiticus]